MAPFNLESARRRREVGKEIRLNTPSFPITNKIEDLLLGSRTWVRFGSNNIGHQIP